MVALDTGAAVAARHEFEETSRSVPVEEPDRRVDSVVAYELAPTGVLRVRAPRAVSGVWSLMGKLSGGAALVLDSMVAEAVAEQRNYPSSFRGHMNLGMAFLAAARFEDAASEFEAVSGVGDAGSEAFLQSKIAKAWLQSGDIVRAAARYEQVLRADGTSMAGLLGLGQVSVLQGNLADARRFLERAVEVDGRSVEARFAFAMAHLLDGPDVRGATRQLRAALRIDMRSAELHHALGVVNLVGGNEPAAEREFRRALALRPWMSSATQGLAEALLREGRPADAVAVNSRLIGATPGSVRAHELLAWSYVASQDYSSAKLELLRALHLALAKGHRQDEQTLARISNNLGVCSRILGDDSQAVTLFKKAIALDATGGPAPYHNLAGLYLGLRAFAKAEEVVANCRRLFPTDEATRILLAYSYSLQDRAADAVHELEEWIGLGRATGDAYATLGGVLGEDLREHERAVDVLRMGIDQFPEHATLVNNLAYSLLALSRPSEAREVLETGLEVSLSATSSPYLAATWGLLRLVEGHVEEGTAYYRRASEAARKLGRATLAHEIEQKMHMEIGRASALVGDWSTAKREWEIGLTMPIGRQTFKRELEALLEGSQER